MKLPLFKFEIRRTAAFTMIEIAIALAVIAFALVAIIGVLPLGMNVQKENREETIINQDAIFLMEAIRNGARGLDDLTNYVIVITNIIQRYEVTRFTNAVGQPTNNWYAFTNSRFNNAPSPAHRLTNGARIIGLLSTPRIIPTETGFDSNFVVAHFRALSGSTIEKFPQTNENMINLAFRYRLVPEVAWLPSPETNTMRKRTFQTNLHELRLSFYWPLLPSGNVGNSRQTFRTLAGGYMARTNDNEVEGTRNVPGPTTWFLQSSTYLTPDD